MRPDDFDDDRDAPQDIDLEWEDDNDDVDVCPVCAGDVHEDAPRCPHCGEWLFGDTPVRQRARGWFWPVIVALLVGVILVMWHGLVR
jgi:predicted nucleic acid-binding Zn ribbon protein